MTKVHPIRTGLVKIRPHQMASRRSGLGALSDILTDTEWSDWLPIYAWAIEHDEGVILVDTGETARVHERGYHPRWHPFYRRAADSPCILKRNSDRNWARSASGRVTSGRRC